MENENKNNQLQIELKEEVAQGTYANLAIITHSTSEFIVDFVRIMPGLPKAQNSTLGTKITSNEAHYFYPFVINPLAYKELVDLGITEGYTEEDYQNFKRTALVSATAFATNSKVGCENEFAVFVETQSDTYLPNLSEYVTFSKDEDEENKDIEDKNINVIGLKNLVDILNDMSQQIKSVEIYYNPYTTKLANKDMKFAKYFNIITSKEVQ